MIDNESIVKAVREYNAAENSLRRAVDELRLLIPAGVVVLHCRPGESGETGTIYWSYEGGSDVFLESAGQKSKYDGYEVIIIEAPARQDEFLPRLS